MTGDQTTTPLAGSDRPGSRIDEIAEALPQRAAMLSRLFLAQSSIRISRTEIGVVQAVAAGPRRITELAARENVTQPAITLLVNRLVERGWVGRESDPLDGRAVLVTISAEGRRIWETLRSEYRALLHDEMVSLDEADVDVLSRAIEILDRLIARLHPDGSVAFGAEPPAPESLAAQG